MLSNQWSIRKKNGRRNNLEIPATYQLESKTRLFDYRHPIINRVEQTLQSIIDKNNTYHEIYTPKIQKVLTEMVRNDVKSFKLDRYRIIVQITVIQKLMNQSVQLASFMLADQKFDETINIKIETKTFNVICLIFLIYKD
jgi:hypothetical protein